MITNASALDWTDTDRGDARFRRKRLSAAAGGERIGCSLYELPPGERSWPYHYHEGNEEALYVLAGEGRLRAADGTHALEPDDYVALPAGGDGAHRVVNDGDEPLRYLAVSTMRHPDVTVYPDSDTVGVFAGRPPGGDGDGVAFFDRDDATDYWEATGHGDGER